MKTILAVIFYWIFCLGYALWLAWGSEHLVNGKTIRVGAGLGRWFQVRGRWARVYIMLMGRRVSHLLEAYGYSK